MDFFMAVPISVILFTDVYIMKLCQPDGILKGGGLVYYQHRPLNSHPPI